MPCVVVGGQQELQTEWCGDCGGGIGFHHQEQWSMYIIICTRDACDAWREWPVPAADLGGGGGGGKGGCSTPF